MTLSPIKSFPKVNIEPFDDLDELETSTDEITKNNREKINIELNQTPSYVPKLFLEQKQGFEKQPVEKIFNAKLISSYSTEELANALVEDFKNHFEMRIQLFFSLLISSYRTDIVFNKFKTYLQVGFKNTDDSGGLVEAHSCILPSLCYLTKKSYEEHFLNDIDSEDEEKNEIELKPIIYAAQTPFQKTLNSTVKLPAFANAIDSSIERRRETFTFNDSFRNYCIIILNENAAGKINPEFGLTRFLKTISKVLDKIDLETKEKGQKIVIKSYIDTVKNYLLQIQNDSFFELFACYFKKPSDELVYEKSNTFYENLAKVVQEQMFDERVLWKCFNVLETQTFEIIKSPSFQDNHAFMRCILFHLKENTEKSVVIQTAINETGEILKKTAWDYIHICSQMENIHNFCIDYLKVKDVESINNDINNEKSEFFTQINPLILEGVQKKRINNSILIAQHILLNVETKQIKSFPIQSFINLNNQWSENYLKKETFIKYLKTCLENENFRKDSLKFINLLKEYNEKYVSLN